MDIKDILNFNYDEELSAERSIEVISKLKSKPFALQSWAKLVREYDPKLHEVMDKAKYPDVLRDDGTIEEVTRVTFNYQRLAVKRLSGLCFGIPVKRVYALDDNDVLGHQIADVIERVFDKARIDSVNLDRAKKLFASCEVMTLWYAQEHKNNYYGIDSGFRLRTMTLSPMLGDNIYPLFDEYGDLIALSVEYTRIVGDRSVSFFDVYTANRHIKWYNLNSWQKIEDEENKLGKIPAVYMYRPTPAWEDTTPLVTEMEWTFSRNGNYLRENSCPLFVVTADEEISFGNEEDNKKAFKKVFRYPAGSSAQYVTWPQSTESLKFHITELRQSYFTQLQLPDWSFENMKTVPMSGEAMKQMYIDAILKCKEESGRLLEFLDREVNVVKSFVKMMKPDDAQWSSKVDSLQVKCVITPCTVIESEAQTEDERGDLQDGKNIQK